jgi:YHS domain-containing protein
LELVRPARASLADQLVNHGWILGSQLRVSWEVQADIDLALGSGRGCNGFGGIALDQQVHASRRTEMERDVVCGMQVDPVKAAGSSQYGGKTYYFCSKGCKAKFDANPGQFAK